MSEREEVWKAPVRISPCLGALPGPCGAEDPCGDAAGPAEHPPGVQSRGRGRAAAICDPKLGETQGISFFMPGAW